MPGYRDRVIHLDFTDELSEDPQNDKIWVKIRNPKLLPPAELQSFGGDGAYEQERDAGGNAVLDGDGKPKMRVTDPAAAQETMRKMIARLVVAARVYDGTDPGQFDPETGEPTGDQQRLPPPPWDTATAAKLPLEIITRITEEFSEAVGPQKPLSGSTSKTSSGSPNPSTTAPGAEGQPPQN